MSTQTLDSQPLPGDTGSPAKDVADRDQEIGEDELDEMSGKRKMKAIEKDAEGEEEEEVSGEKKDDIEEDGTVVKKVRKRRSVSRVPAASIDRPSRARKTVERYSASTPTPKSVPIKRGHGTKLREIPNVFFKLSKRKADENLQHLHRILYGKKAKVRTLKRSILDFSGFVWTSNEDREKLKLREKLDRCVKDKLFDFCDMFDIHVAKATTRKEDILTLLLDFLQSPHLDQAMDDHRTKIRRRLEKLLFFFTAVSIFTFLADVRYFSLQRSLLHRRNQLSKFPTREFENHINLAISGNNRMSRRMTTVRSSLLSPLAGVLLPDCQVLLLLDSSLHDAYYYTKDSSLTCVFQDGATSPAHFAGVLASSDRPTFKCAVPKSIHIKKNPTGRFHLTKPLLVDKRTPPAQVAGRRTDEMLLWWNLLVYESFSTAEDVVVFAKGVNNRQNKNRSPSVLSCIFQSSSHTVTTIVTSSAQEVFRCHHPEPSSFPTHPEKPITVSLQITHFGPIPSVAQYKPQLQKSSPSEKSLICACTMVRNVGKFVPEWVTFHSSIGVSKFFFYENGSDDELDDVINTTVTNHPKKINITTYHWPWAKTQEAGFSHCAVANRETCKWMMFLDVDEFVFMPSWENSTKPSPTMLSAILPTTDGDERIGQLLIPCQDYGPSGQTQHPSSGVIYGYTCRRNVEERHKSIVRLGGVDDSLRNVVHHFTLKGGYVGRRLRSWEAVVNHYKYQAWVEFRHKFRQRVSAYVPDWTEATNPNSKDRTPGLGFEPIEPADWTRRFCDVNDTRLRDVSWRWFHRVGPDGFSTMAWDFGRINLQSQSLFI